MNGYWFCEHCDEIVILPRPDYSGRWEEVPREVCPACHLRTAKFMRQLVAVPGPVTGAPYVVKKEFAIKWFEKIRKSL